MGGGAGDAAGGVAFFNQAVAHVAEDAGLVIFGGYDGLDDPQPADGSGVFLEQTAGLGGEVQQPVARAVEHPGEGRRLAKLFHRFPGQINILCQDVIFLRKFGNLGQIPSGRNLVVAVLVLRQGWFLTRLFSAAPQNRALCRFVPLPDGFKIPAKAGFKGVYGAHFLPGFSFSHQGGEPGVAFLRLRYRHIRPGKVDTDIGDFAAEGSGRYPMPVLRGSGYRSVQGKVAAYVGGCIGVAGDPTGIGVRRDGAGGIASLRRAAPARNPHDAAGLAAAAAHPRRRVAVADGAVEVADHAARRRLSGNRAGGIAAFDGSAVGVAENADVGGIRRLDVGAFHAEVLDGARVHMDQAALGGGIADDFMTGAVQNAHKLQLGAQRGHGRRQGDVCFQDIIFFGEFGDHRQIRSTADFVIPVFVLGQRGLLFLFSRSNLLRQHPQHRPLAVFIPLPDRLEIPAEGIPIEGLVLDLCQGSVGALFGGGRRHALLLGRYHDLHAAVVVFQHRGMSRLDASHHTVGIAVSVHTVVQSDAVPHGGPGIAITHDAARVLGVRGDGARGIAAFGHAALHAEADHASSLCAEGMHIRRRVAVPDNPIGIAGDAAHPGRSRDCSADVTVLDGSAVEVAQNSGRARVRFHIANDRQITDNAVVGGKQAGALARICLEAADGVSAAVKYAGEIGQLGADRAIQLQIIHQPEMGRWLVGEIDEIVPGINFVRLLRGAEALHPLTQGLSIQNRLSGIQSAPDHHLEHVGRIEGDRGGKGYILLFALALQGNVHSAEIQQFAFVFRIFGGDHGEVLAGILCRQEADAVPLLILDVGGAELKQALCMAQSKAVHNLSFGGIGGQGQAVLVGAEHHAGLDILVVDHMIPPEFLVVIELRAGGAGGDEGRALVHILRIVGGHTVADGGSLVDVVVPADIQADAQLLAGLGHLFSLLGHAGIGAVPGTEIGEMPHDNPPGLVGGPHVLLQPFQLFVQRGGGIEHRDVHLADVVGIIAFPYIAAVLGQVVHLVKSRTAGIGGIGMAVGQVEIVIGLVVAGHGGGQHPQVLQHIVAQRLPVFIFGRVVHEVAQLHHHGGVRLLLLEGGQHIVEQIIVALLGSGHLQITHNIEGGFPIGLSGGEGVFLAGPAAVGRNAQPVFIGRARG